MAGRGPAPKPAEARRRRNKVEPPKVLEADGKLHGPDLPDVSEPWHPRTLAWWDTWRRSAQAKTFVGTDWDFLIDTALMHHTMWSKGRWEFAAELRLRAAKFGATPEDRARLKIEATEAQPPVEPKSPTKTSTNRRERLLRAVGDGDSA